MYQNPTLPFNDNPVPIDTTKRDIIQSLPEYQSINIGIHPTSAEAANSLRDKTNGPAFDKNTYLRNIGQDLFSNNKVVFKQEITDISQAYAQVGDSSFVPRYDTYFHGLNNEDLYAQNQGTISKWVNGIGKNAFKAGSYVLDGTVGTVVGIVNGLSQGSFDAVWDNGFTSWIDENNKRMDYALPNYIAEEEKNMNFLRSLGTANFWANDVLGGVAFMAGAIGSEAIWAAATGGSSLALAGAKWGLRTAGSIARGTRLASETGALATNAKKALTAYNRTIAASNVGKAVNNTRFMMTSAGFEAGVESRSSLDESLLNFQEAIKMSEGRMPTQEEYREFMSDAVDNSNRVFIANMAIVGSSNVLQFGKFFNLSTGLSDKVSKSVGKSLFGVGLTKGVDGTVAAIKANAVQKGLGRTVAFLRNPFVEGFEEGAQGTVSRMSQKLLASKYDPTALKENYTNMEALQDAFIESFGSREGFKEVGIGMLIGKFGDFSTNLKQRGSAGLSGFNANLKNQLTIADQANKANMTLTSVGRKALERMLTVNQQITAANSAANANAAGKFTEASQYFDQASFAKMMGDIKAGMIDESLADFSLALSKVDNNIMAEELGLDISQVQDAKSAMVEEYAANVKTFKKAYETAQALNPNTKAGLKGQHYVEELASNFYLGTKSMERLDALAQSVETATGQMGFADSMKFYSNMDSKMRNNVMDLKAVNTRIENLDKEYAELQQKYSILQETKPRTEENKGNTGRIEANRKKAGNVLERKRLLEERRTEIENIIKTNPVSKNYAFGNLFNAQFVTPDELVNATEEIAKLDEYIDALEKSDKQAAENLRYLVQEYGKNQIAFESFHDTYQKLADPRFNFASYKGVAKLINNSARFSKPADNKTLTPEEQAVEDFIQTNKMDDYEAFNFRLFSKLSQELYKGDFKSFTLEDFIDPVSESEWTAFVTSKTASDTTLNALAEKQLDDKPLSNRERRIKDFFEKEVKDRVKAINKARGDSLRKAIKKPELNPALSTTSDTIKDLIDQILRSKNYLTGIQVNDVTPESIPTEAEFREINKLQRALEEDGSLSKKSQKRYDELFAKISAWGAIEGTFSGRHSLGELYNQLFALENFKPETIRDETAGVVVSDVMNADEIEALSKRTYYNMLQSYDKAFFSRDEDGVHIHNVNLDGFIQNIQNDVEIKFVKVDGKTKDVDALTGVNFDRNARIEYLDTSGTAKTIAISRGLRGDLVMSEASVRNVNEDTSIKIGVTIRNAKMPTNYFTVLKRTEENGVTKLVPLPSNFVETNISSSPQKIQRLKKGDILSMEVDMTDDYNKKLLRDYKKNGDLDAFTHNLKIRFVDDENNLAGVLKSQKENNGMVVNQKHYDKMARMRVEAATKVLDDPTPGNVVPLDSTIDVKSVFLGHPVLNIEETASGQHAIRQNRFTEESVKNISDIGYILNGKYYLNKGTDKSRLTESYVHSVIKNKNGKYTDRRVPVVVISFNGRNIAYPVSLIPEVVNNSGLAQAIVDSDATASEKAIKLNELLMQSEVDVEKMHIRSDNYLQRMEDIKNVLNNQNKFVDLEEWVNEDTDIPTTLIKNAMIDLDMRGDMFHSPKVTLEFGTASEETPQVETEMEEEDMDAQVTLEQSASVPFVFTEEMQNSLAGIKNEDDFLAAVLAIQNEALTERYTTDSTFARNLFETMSKMQVVPVMKEAEGQIVPQENNDTEELMRNTLKSRIGNFGISSNYEFLQTISEVVWHEHPEEVKKVLQQIADEAIKTGIDVQDLAMQYDEKPQSEIMSFLTDLTNFTSQLNLNVATEADKNAFAASYDGFYGLQKTERETTIPESDLNLVIINTNMDEVQLYEAGYINIKDNVYQKIQKDSSDIYSTVYDMVLEDPTILPKVAYYPIGYTSSHKFEPSRVTNPDNRVAVINAIKRYVQKLASEYATTSTAENKQALEDIIIYKLAFKHPIVTANQSVNTDAQYDNYKAFDGDIVYLTGEFLSDFHIEQSIEKAKDSAFYRNVLSHFEVTDRGLSLRNSSQEAMRQIANNTPNTGIGKDLRNYSIISKDKNVNSLFNNNVGENVARSIPFFRNLYLNNPKLLQEFDGKYTVEDNGTLAIANLTDNFLRIQDRIFERVGEAGYIGFYAEVKGVTSPDFNVIDASLSVPSEYTTSDAIFKIQEGANYMEVTPLYKKAEENSLNANLDACS